ncbi:MAG: hypothetical protein ACLPQ6_05620 [Steroidobacteraceae bacterium]|jgi:hypothetical protein
MPGEHPVLIRVGMLSAAVLAIVGCTHVADVLTNTGTALRRHADAGNGATSSSGATSGASVSKEQEAINDSVKAWKDACKASYATPELDPIRHKVELWREPGDDPLPFEIATNSEFPTADERPVIAKWASLRDECIHQWDALQLIPASANSTQTAMFKQLRALVQQTAGDITELMIGLYQQKLTYGEYGRKAYEIGKAMGEFTLAIQQAGASSNNAQQQLQDVGTAQQQFTDTLDAFGKYVRAVNARKPKTVRMSGAGT